MTQYGSPGRGRTGTRILIGVVAAAVVAVAVYIFLTQSGPGVPPEGETASPTPSGTSQPTPGQEQPVETPAPSRTSPAPVPSPSITPSRAPTTPGVPEPLRPELEAVEPDQTAVGEDGLMVALTSIEPVQGVAVQPGEVSGPAIRVTITITNRSDAPIDTGLIAVSAYSGEDRTPAGTVIKPGALPFEGTIAPGESTYAIYVFVIPLADRADVTITLDYLNDLAVVVFRGDMR